MVYTCKLFGKKKRVSKPKLAYPKTGTIYTISGNQYKVTKVGTEVSLIHTQKNANSISIPATITVQGITYKVVTIETRVCLKNHSYNLHTLICGRFCPHSVDVARYAALIRAKSPTNYDAHLAESLFQTRSRADELKLEGRCRGIRTGYFCLL